MRHCIHLLKASPPYDEFSSFRPVSNLLFISKCVEKVVGTQTCMHVDDNNLSKLYQSAYKRHYSTEKALIIPAREPRSVEDESRSGEKRKTFFKT